MQKVLDLDLKTCDTSDRGIVIIFVKRKEYPLWLCNRLISNLKRKVESQMKKVLFFAYPQYADFEIGHALFLLRKVCKAEITTVSIGGNSVESLGGLWTQVSASIAEINIKNFDLILMSGGDGIQEVIDNEEVLTMLKTATINSIPIASICASAALLGKAGILVGRKFTCLPSTIDQYTSLFELSSYTSSDIEVENTIITAKGTAFAEFAVAVCQQLGYLLEKEKSDSILKFCKGVS
jgi:protein deglycase